LIGESVSDFAQAAAQLDVAASSSSGKLDELQAQVEAIQAKHQSMVKQAVEKKAAAVQLEKKIIKEQTSASVLHAAAELS
jgi:hypothetical protein